MIKKGVWVCVLFVWPLAGWCQTYVYNDSMGKKTMEWAPPPPKAEEKKAKTKEEKQAEREASKREHLLRTAKDEAGDKFDDWTEEHANDGDWPQWFIDAAVADMVREICDYGSGDLELVVDAFAKNTGFKASDAEANKVYQEYLAEVYKALRPYLPDRNA